jgi:leucyl-tRNA synthetase
MQKYNHQQIEKKWQEIWEQTKLYHASDTDKREKLYHLVMFPYPSGDLHLGHWYNYAGADFRARYKRMKGYNLMSPIGFDAFGLPAENAAIKNKTHPKEWTYKNIERMRAQLKTIGTVFDWEREVVTCDPDYYKWTQWMFLFMYKNGLAYKKKQVANWCPSCNTVLANEQVIGEGVCERCKTTVEQRELDQWMFKITDYADELIDGLEKIDWPEKTKTMQRNWVGRSEGAEVIFQVSGTKDQIPVFTTRPDTLFGATFMVLAPEHQLVAELLASTKSQAPNTKEIESYVEKAKKKTELQRMEEGKNKTGVFSGLYAVNPVNGKEIPIWISDYVLMSYGHGAIMAVPAHDERDWDFAKKYKLPIIEVLKGGDVTKEAYTEDGIHVNSEYLDGLNKEEAITKVIEALSKDKKAKKTINYRLRDWIISRQRYWGAPIPITYCRQCWEDKVDKKKEISESEFTIIDGQEHLMVPVEERDLPVLLPEDVDMKPTGQSPLVTSEKFVNTTCPKCGGPAKRETDTMDTFLCSSWYYFRYLDNANDKEFCDKDKLKKWMPVDMYIGGAEHSVLHLLYSRFFTKALREHGEQVNFDEPFSALRHQGTILGEDGQKMSKSIGNVVNPDEEVSRVGGDAVRLFMGFMGPYDQGGPWNPNGVTGCKRFLDKVWALAGGKLSEIEPGLIEAKLLNKAIKKVGEDLEDFKFNTAISTLMVLTNELSSLDEPSKRSVELLLLLLAPFAPHLAEELWENLGNKESIHVQAWPEYDQKLTEDEIVTIVVQVNGKVRANIEMNKNCTQDLAEKTALADENVKKFMEGQKPKKIIYIQDKILNIVI